MQNESKISHVLFQAWKMALLGWSTAALFSSPQLYIFTVNHNDDPTSRFSNKTLCESIFRFTPASHRQAYLTYIGLMTFYIPLLVVSICYIRIFMKIASKARQNKGGCKKPSPKPGKLQLQSTGNTSLPKAKIKTLKMTLVIVASFIICGLPYHILEMIYSYGSHEKVPGNLAAILGSMAVANSATNPYVFLLFNANLQCMRGVLSNKRTYFDLMNSMATTQTEVTRGTTVKYNGVHHNSAAFNNHHHRLQPVSGDVLEMKIKPKGNGNYVLVNNSEKAEENAEGK